MARRFRKRWRRPKTKMGVPLLPESQRPCYNVEIQKGRSNKPEYIAKITIGDITAYGTGKRRNWAKRNAMDAAVKSGIARLKFGRLYKSFEDRPFRQSSKYGEIIDLTGESSRPQEVIVVADDEICNVTITDPKPKDTTEIIDIMDGDDSISECDVELPSPETDSDREMTGSDGCSSSLTKNSSSEKPVVVRDYIIDYRFGYKRLIDVRDIDYGDLSFGFARPADTDSAVIDLTNDNVIDLTVDA